MWNKNSKCRFFPDLEGCFACVFSQDLSEIGCGAETDCVADLLDGFIGGGKKLHGLAAQCPETKLVGGLPGVLFEQSVKSGLAYATVGRHLGDLYIGIIVNVPGGFLNNRIAIRPLCLRHLFRYLCKKLIQYADAFLGKWNLLT